MSTLKETEVGRIPAEWNVRPLIGLVSIANGQVNPLQEPYRSMILVAPDHIESGTGRLIAKRTAEDQKAISGKYLFKKGDILYSKIRPYLRKACLSDFDGLCSADMYPLTVQPRVSAGFILNVILGHRFSTFAENVSARSGMPKINREELSEYVVAVPPLNEQRAIAEALSDVDALINALDALITKKRHIKQGTMQQLLTGKKRLPQFEPKTTTFKQTEAGIIPDDWEVKPLIDVFHFMGGKAHEPFVSEHGKYVVVNSKFVSTEGRVRKYCDRNVSPTQKGSILMVMSDLPNGKALAKCFLVDKDNIYAVNQRICSLKPKKDHSEYLFYALNRHPYFLKFNDGVSQTHLLNPIVFACPVVVPKNTKEQEAIASVLHDMESEITALEQKRDKTKLIKQGMMQELLTGKTRLI